MRHAQSKALHAYWQARRFGGAAPYRADIEPQDIAALLGHVFILGRIDPQHHVFRLAGTGLCELYQREFRDQNFLSLWRGHDATHIQAVLEASLGGVSPASVIARATTMEMNQIPIEVCFLPLRGPEGLVDRTLGLFQPLEPVETLRGRPIIRTSLREVRPPANPGFLFPRQPLRDSQNPAMVANDQ
ncbi:PAS domain-containing protein [uncultured Maricaulis sp.]|uniref:PAS domain-containing protein n=1 Tax=uncultured Maricaulis sp. TaxID=174710 RepID=UPI0030D8CB13|tara:strand:- start:70190 stop:70750 length:561 start_codon:yes stop_codon:yes gene_type:complete